METQYVAKVKGRNVIWKPFVFVGVSMEDNGEYNGLLREFMDDKFHAFDTAEAMVKHLYDIAVKTRMINPHQSHLSGLMDSLAAVEKRYKSFFVELLHSQWHTIQGILHHKGEKRMFRNHDELMRLIQQNILAEQKR